MEIVSAPAKAKEEVSSTWMVCPPADNRRALERPAEFYRDCPFARSQTYGSSPRLLQEQLSLRKRNYNRLLRGAGPYALTAARKGLGARLRRRQRSRTLSGQATSTGHRATSWSRRWSGCLSGVREEWTASTVAVARTVRLVAGSLRAAERPRFSARERACILEDWVGVG